MNEFHFQVSARKGLKSTGFFGQSISRSDYRAVVPRPPQASPSSSSPTRLVESQIGSEPSFLSAWAVFTPSGALRPLLVGGHTAGTSLSPPGDEGHRQAEGSEGWGHKCPLPGPVWGGAGGLDRGCPLAGPWLSRALRSRHTKPLSVAGLPRSRRRCSGGGLTSSRKQAAPGLVGAAGHRGCILPAGPAAGGGGLARGGPAPPPATWPPDGLTPEALVTWTSSDSSLPSGSLSAQQSVVCGWKDIMLPKGLAGAWHTIN